MTAAPDYGNHDDGPRPVSRFEWERIIRRTRIASSIKLVAFVMATYADADGTRVRPGVDALAVDTGQSAATVKRAIAALRKQYGLIEQVSRGGGRDGRGKAAEYRLVVPLDLLERVDLAPVVPAQRKVSQLIIVSPQTGPSSVDEPESGITAMSPETPDSQLTIVTHENDFQGSPETTSDGMRDQKTALRDHSCDPLPIDQPLKDDHELGCDPTEPPTARAPVDDEHPDLPIAELKPAKCQHGLRAHIRDDGRPTCPMCRRLPGGSEPP